MEYKTLNNGEEIPVLGLGVYESGKDTKNAVILAMEVGYRHVDTATIYGNEKEVGDAIKESGVGRKNVFITTKLWNDDMRAGLQREAIEKSLERLGTDYIDLYLIHWPVAEVFIDSWKIMEEYYKKGVLKAIGVSNFNQKHIDDLLNVAETVPACNQIELHPFLTQQKLVDYNRSLGIATECWSPLGRGKIFGNETLEQIANTHQKTVAQVALRWEIQRGLITIPKSVHQERIKDNFNVFDFTLSADEMQAISDLNKDERVLNGIGPDNFNF